MPHFYMNVRRVDEYIEDLEGQDFPSLVEAHAAAIGAARELMANAVRMGKPANHSEFEIADDAGLVLLTVPFSEAIE